MFLNFFGHNETKRTKRTKPYIEAAYCLKSNKNGDDQNIIQECVRQELQDAQVIPEQSPIINKYIPPPNNGPPSIPPHGRLAYKDRPRFKFNIKIKTTVKENKLELSCAKLKA